MKKSLFAASFAVLALTGPVIAADIVVTAANLSDYTGAASIAISAGDTLHFSGITSAYTLSAPISGGGTLLIDGCTGAATLSGDNSSFSGTLLVTNSDVTVGHAHALGSAAVNIVTDSSAVRTFLYSATGEFPNNIALNTKSTRTGTSAFRYSVADGHTVTNSGTLTFTQPNDSSPRIEVGKASKSDQTGRLVLTGTLDKPNGYGYLYFYGPLTLARTFTGSGLTGGNAFFLNGGCDAILEKDVSDIILSTLQAAKGTLRFAAEDCLTTRTLTIGTTSSPDQTVQFDGYDQHFATVKSVAGTSSNEYKTENKVYTSSAPATMTITRNFSNGANSIQGWGRFRGHLSFAFNSDGGSGAYCGINTYGASVNDTDGSFTAINGTLHLGDNMVFTALSALVVTNAGSIALATGRFNETCDVYLSGTGKLILSNNVTLAVNRVFYMVGDEFVQASANNYTAGAEGVEAYLDGEGTLTVKTSPPVTKIDYHWASEGDTSLTASANWQENESPGLSDGAAYLHFNGGSSAAEVASDIALYGLDFTRGTDFTLNGTGRTVSVGEGGFIAANTDSEVVHAVTVSPTLNLDWTNNVWAIGANTHVTFAGGLSSPIAGRSLTISGGETAASGNLVTFAGNSAESAMSVVVTNVAAVTVASDTALPAQGLTTYNVMPDFNGVTSNGAPVMVDGISHNFSEAFWSNGVFRQTGLFALRSVSIASGHRGYINITGGEAQFLGGLRLSVARHLIRLFGEGKMRLGGTIYDAAAGFDLRGENVANNEVRSSATMAAGAELYIGTVRFICEAEDVLPPYNASKVNPVLSLGIQGNGHNHGVMAILDLNGYDQNVNNLNGPAYEKMSLPAGAHALVTSETPATFNLRHATGNALMVKFSGAANLTFDCSATSGTTLTLTNVVSDTTGDLLVKNGKVKFAYGAGWGGSSNVTVAAGATLGVTDTGAATAFARVDGGPSIVNLKLEADGESYGKLDLGGNVSVKTLRIGDTFLPAGDYGSTESGARNTNDNHFTGVGVLHVRRSGLISPLHLMIR